MKAVPRPVSPPEHCRWPPPSPGPAVLHSLCRARGGGSFGERQRAAPDASVPLQLPYTELEKVSGIEEAKHYLRQKLRELRF